MFLFINLSQLPANQFIMNKLRPCMPPFGIAHIGAILRQAGFRCELHDDNLNPMTDAELRALLRARRGDLQAIGLTSVSTTLRQLARVAGIAKEETPGTPVIVGGPHARLLPDETIAIPGVDVVFTCEAELPIEQFARGEPLAGINGIFYRDGDRVVRNPPGDIVQDLDQVPFPDYDLFRIADYHTTRGIAKRHPASYVITSRGCPYNCTFCSSRALNPTTGKKVRFRSPANVLEEIELLVRKHGVKELFFSDDMFTGKESHLAGVCEGLIRKRLDLAWVCQTHVNNITTEKLRLMKQAGCHQICFGVESGDPGIQVEINKKLDLEKVRSVVRMTLATGIDARCSFMFGNQHETPATMQRTLDFARSLAPTFASFNIATPYPGTALRSWAVENGYLVDSSYEALDSTRYTLVTPDLPPGTVEAYCNKAFRSFYYTPRYVLRRLGRMRDLEEVARVGRSAYYAASTMPLMLRGLFGRQRG
jgi:anaerobic magnesium-protoporphyrin IX monomethyl ester cyclase